MKELHGTKDRQGDRADDIGKADGPARRFPRESLALKMLRPLLASICFLFVFFTSIFGFFQYKYLKNESIRESERLAGICAVILPPLLARSDHDGIERLLKIVSADEKTAGIAVESEDWNYSAAKRNSPGDFGAVEKEMISPYDGRRIGTVRVYPTLSRARRAIFLTAGFAGVFLMVLSVAVWLTGRFQTAKWVVKPVEELAEAVTAHMETGKLPGPHVERHDEIGRLAGLLKAFLEKTENGVFLQRKELEEKRRETVRLKAELKRQSGMDDLTRLCNRMEFDRQIGAEWRRLKRDGLPLSLMLCDIDRFRSFRERCGASASDDCIREIAGVLKKHCRRPADLAVRFGPWTLAALLPQTDRRGALAVAESIRLEVEKLRIPNAGSPCGNVVTLSLGVGTIVPSARNEYNYLVALADAALYESVKKGGNRISFNEPDEC